MINNLRVTPKQEIILRYFSQLDWLCLGGNRGGGKTYAALLLALQHIINAKEKAKHCRILVLRKEYQGLEDIKEKVLNLYAGLGRMVGDKPAQFRFKNGAKMLLNFVKDDRDITKFQGHEYTMVIVDEAAQFLSPNPIFKVYASQRNTYKIKSQLVFTSNPSGGTGVGGGSWWLKQSFDIENKNIPLERNKINSKGQPYTERALFFEMLLRDNPILLEADPEYENRLREATKHDPALQKAWLDGDWDYDSGGVFEGAFKREKNVIKLGGEIANAKVSRAYDPSGGAAPFAVLWSIKCLGDTIVPILTNNEETRIYKKVPKGSIIVRKEWYGCQPADPYKGLGWDEERIIDGIIERDESIENCYRPFLKGVSDVMTGLAKTDISKAEYHRKRGFYWNKPYKYKIPGYDKLKRMMRSAWEDDPKTPALFITEDCWHLLREIQEMQYAGIDSDGTLDKNCSDHAVDALRYEVMQDREKKNIRRNLSVA